MSKKITVTQIRSAIGKKPQHRATLRALGLRRLGAQRVHDDNPVIQGMVNAVKHLVRVESSRQKG